MNKYVCFLTAIAGVLLISVSQAVAQNPVNWVGMTGAYGNPDNWDTGFPPDVEFNEEDGFINNGGTAQVESDVLFAPRDLILGNEADDLGTLEFMNGGVLTVARDLIVGNEGEGHLIVHPGGSLTVENNLLNQGAEESSILVGGAAAGNATVTVTNEAQLLRNTRVVGPNADFSAGSIILGDSHTLTAGITGPDHSPLQATGTATLGGTLNLEFDGVTPGPGDAWQIVDAANINGSFASVNSNVAIPDQGYRFFVQTDSGGANGQVLEVAVETRLLLEVDRETGNATLTNLTASDSFNIDGYVITSSSSSLDPNGWDSFQGSGLANWRESNPAPHRLAELNPLDSRVVGPEETISLGSIYAPSQFGVGGDLAFEYQIAGGEAQVGLVEYMGPQNNLVLIVDPDTGEAALQNQSPLDIDIDGYAITSASNALNPDGWSSLADSGLPGWRESNPAPNHIVELTLGSSVLGGRDSPIPLGTLFDVDNPSAEQDLHFEFQIAGGESMVGIVEYRDIPDMQPTIPGDYNNNGRVEQADLDLVLLNWNESVDNLPADWINERPTSGIIDQAELDGVLLNWNRTTPGLGTASAVPEPSTLALLLVVAGLGLGLARKRSMAG